MTIVHMGGIPLIDMTGQTYGMLRVIDRAPDHVQASGRLRVMWNVQCECGSPVKAVDGGALRAGLTTSCGCKRMSKAPTYITAHDRVRAARGKASAYPCVDECGSQAAEWSYDHTDPDELWGTVGVLHAVYSLDINRYKPRCARCHRIFDGHPVMEGRPL